MEVLVVFTACSCRLSDVRQEFEANDRDFLLSCKIDDGSADFVVLVPHPPLFLLIASFDSLRLLLFAECLPFRTELAFHILVLTTVPEETGRVVIGDGDRRHFQSEVNPHHPHPRPRDGRDMDGNLSNPLPSLLRDPERPEFVGKESGIPIVLINHGSMESHLHGLPVHPNGEGDALEVEGIVLIVPNADWLFEDRDAFEILFPRLLVDADGISCELVLHGARKGSVDVLARPPLPVLGGDHVRHDSVGGLDIGLAHPF